MKAEDTIDDAVLTEMAEMLYNFRNALDIKGIKSILWQQANQQSKISFQAGYNQCLKDHNLDITTLFIRFVQSINNDSKQPKGGI